MGFTSQRWDAFPATRPLPSKTEASMEVASYKAAEFLKYSSVTSVHTVQPQDAFLGSEAGFATERASSTPGRKAGSSPSLPQIQEGCRADVIITEVTPSQATAALLTGN